MRSHRRVLALGKNDLGCCTSVIPHMLFVYNFLGLMSKVHSRSIAFSTLFIQPMLPEIENPVLEVIHISKCHWHH
jgi:hypothetical protein